LLIVKWELVQCVLIYFLCSHSFTCVQVVYVKPLSTERKRENIARSSKREIKREINRQIKRGKERKRELENKRDRKITEIKTRENERGKTL
jgi:hypothetical protein